MYLATKKTYAKILQICFFEHFHQQMQLFFIFIHCSKCSTKIKLKMKKKADGKLKQTIVVFDIYQFFNFQSFFFFYSFYYFASSQLQWYQPWFSIHSLGFISHMPSVSGKHLYQQHSHRYSMLIFSNIINANNICSVIFHKLFFFSSLFYSIFFLYLCDYIAYVFYPFFFQLFLFTQKKKNTINRHHLHLLIIALHKSKKE